MKLWSTDAGYDGIVIVLEIKQTRGEEILTSDFVAIDTSNGLHCITVCSNRYMIVSCFSAFKKQLACLFFVAETLRGAALLAGAHTPLLGRVLYCSSLALDTRID